MLFATLIFTAVLAIILAPYWLFIVRPDARQQAVLHKRLNATLAQMNVATANLVKDEDRLSSLPVFDAALRRVQTWTMPLRGVIEQSGLRINMGTLLTGCVSSSLLLFVIATRLTKHPLAGMVAGVVGALLPYVWVKRARARRLWKFEEQFPEAVDLLARSLRAGHALPSGLALAAEELSEPVGGEFKLLHDRQNFGMPLTEALRDFARRVPLLDAQFFVTAVLTQREAGGNLAEVLDNLSGVVRERFKVKRQVRVISAHGRITGWILAAMAPALALVFFVVSPQHVQILLSDPLGIQMIWVAATLQVIGALAIRKLVNIEY